MTENFDAIYNMLWDTSYNAVSQGDIEIDDLISHPEADKRRGLTLIFRPTDAVKQSILTFLNELRRIEPDQYYYPETSLHFTVLSLFTATVEHQREYDRIQAYQTAVDSAVRGISPFLFQVKGLTVSKSAVILCGYPLPDNLNILRNALRKNLITSGLAQGLDRRYILTAAHTTIMRFSRPLSNPTGLAEFLLENKQKTFGEFQVDGLDLVKNDWYMAQHNTTVVCRYRLNPKAI
jgi:2'-5' RNA ligase